jgi:hypothetical protein
LTGQTWTQSPHPTHKSGSIFVVTFSNIYLLPDQSLRGIHLKTIR